MSFAYYNEIEPYAVEWLRNLRQHGHIADGHIDDRSIVELDHHAMLAASTQAHFFAGIGVWSAALRAAGWPDDAEVWTGSCPCQPFSSAGSRKGTDDERHLWPKWFDLIRQHRPPIILGEQVASPDALAWFDVVRADLEGAGYAVAAFDLCAAGVGAPHIRQRLFFVGLANNNNQRLERVRLQLRERRSQQDLLEASRRGEAHERMGDPDDARSQGRIERGNGARQRSIGAPSLALGLADATEEQHNGRRFTGRRLPEPSDDCDCGHRATDHEGLVEDCHACSCTYFIARGVGNSSDDGDRQHDGELPRDESECEEWAEEGDHVSELASATRGFWADAEWIPCRDGKWRPVEPGTFPLAHGSPNRVGRLRAYGNAVVKPLAETFIRAIIDHIIET